MVKPRFDCPNCGKTCRSKSWGRLQCRRCGYVLSEDNAGEAQPASYFLAMGAIAVVVALVLIVAF